MGARCTTFTYKWSVEAVGENLPTEVTDNVATVQQFLDGIDGERVELPSDHVMFPSSFLTFCFILS